MGDIVLFSRSLKFPQKERKKEIKPSRDQPNLGLVNDVYEFFFYERPPLSGFPVSEPEERILTFVFSPISGQWSRNSEKQMFLANLPTLLSKLETVEWCGRRYMVERVMDFGVVTPDTSVPAHIGRLCIQLIVRELKI